MKNLISVSLRYENNKLTVINQKLLPQNEEWIDCHSIQDMCDAIYDLKVRGAPLIGVAAAISLAQYVEQGCSEDELVLAAAKMRATRPTAVNLMAAVDRLMAYEVFDKSEISSIAERIFDEDVELCQSIAKHGADLIQTGDNILTHCNAGALATVGVGTAIGVIHEAHRQGKKIHVYVDETRPLLQGARLTTWELKKLGIPYTLICDNMAAQLMASGKIQKAIVGADRIAVNGDFANKVGTYSVAISCAYHKIPFYVAAPYTTVDTECGDGSQIPIELRREDEVRGVVTGLHEQFWAPRDAKVYNPAFDVTPASLVSRWVLDRGVFNYEQIKSGILKS